MNGPEYMPSNTTQKVRRKRMGIYLMIPLILSMMALCILSREWRESLKLESISVKGTRSLTVNAVTMLANVPLKSAFYDLDLLSIREKIMTEPLLKDARLNREFPGILQIEITEREPIAALNCGQMRFVDAEGVVLPYLNGERKLDLPLIIGISGLQSERVGKPILNKELFTALEIIQQAQTLDSAIYHMISELDMNGGGDIKINSLDAGIPVTLGRQDIPKKLLMFETFWSNYVNPGDGQKLKYVDLRFDDQVVVRWSQPSEPQSKKATL